MTARARDFAVVPVTGDTGPDNAITDVTGISVGQVTVRNTPDVHSGVTAIVPDGVGPGSPVTAGAHVGNGFGKLIGYTQLVELGQLESPIVLTSTLSAFRAADAVVEWMVRHPDWREVTTFNPVVGECNDGHLSDIRARPVTTDHVITAIESARSGPVEMGCVGAGTGTGAMGFKAGIGSASRVVDVEGRSVTIGGLVQANFGGTLRIDGELLKAPISSTTPPDAGSCMLVLATDGGLDARQLNRLAARAVYGLGRVGASYSHGSGDYAIAVDTGENTGIGDESLNPLFLATLDLVEEMVLDSLLAAVTTDGYRGRRLVSLTDSPAWRDYLGRR